jgi:hypothetical protein
MKLNPFVDICLFGGLADDEGHSLVHWAAKRGDLLMVQVSAVSTYIPH